jgi:hypothetical protein
MKKITFLILILSMFSCAKKIYTSNEYFNTKSVSIFSISINIYDFCQIVANGLVYDFVAYLNTKISK